MLYELPHLDLEEVQNLFDLIQYLRIKGLSLLLQSCRSIKVVRLFAKFASASSLLDVEALYNELDINRGSSSIWQVSAGEGRRITVKPRWLR